MHFPSITELVAYSDITVGVLSPIKCVATACDEDSTLAMLAQDASELPTPGSVINAPI